MALTECRECGGQVSNKADACPNCGVSNPAGGLLNQEISGCSGCLIVSLVVAIIIAIFGSGSDDSATSDYMDEPSASSSPSRSTSSHVLRYVGRTINIRSGPGTGHEVVDQYSAGDRIYVDQRTSEWSVVYAGPLSNDTVGYVLGELLSDSPPPDLQVVSHDTRSGEYGTWYIVGRIRNNSDQTYGYVQVSINLYDANNAQVGSTMTNVNNLEPGGVWRFEALVTNDRARRYRIADVTAF